LLSVGGALFAGGSQDEVCRINGHKLSSNEKALSPIEKLMTFPPIKFSLRTALKAPQFGGSTAQTFSRKENNNMSVEQLIGDLLAELTGVIPDDLVTENERPPQNKDLFQPDQEVFHPDYVANDLRFGVLEEP